MSLDFSAPQLLGARDKKKFSKFFSKIFFQIQKNYYRVSPIIRPTRKIRPSVIFEDDFNISATLKISPS